MAVTTPEAGVPAPPQSSPEPRRPRAEEPGEHKSPLAIYKPGQGYWTRVLTAVGAGVLVLSGVAWLVNQIASGMGESQWLLPMQAGVAVGIILVAGIALFRILNTPRVADFMIATEAEMRKVNWPDRREVIGSTWVVIVGTVLMAIFLFVVDLIFAELFIDLGVLEGDSLLRRLWHGIFG
jgi:preprotein translocase subunit SecE